MLRAEDPDYRRERAEEALAIASHMKDPAARRIMEEIAASYQNLAARIERSREELNQLLSKPK